MLLRRSTALILSLLLLVTTVAFNVFVNANTDAIIPTVVYDFENEQKLPYSGMSYTTEETASGTNGYMIWNAETGGGYPVLSFKTDYTLVKNQEYTVTFKYKLDLKTTGIYQNVGKGSNIREIQ